MMLLQTPLGRTTTLVYSPDGRWLTAVVEPHERLWVWDVANQCPAPWEVAHAAELCAVAFSPDGSLLATSDGHGLVLIRDLHTHAELWRTALSPGAANCLTFSPDSARLAAGGHDWLMPRSPVRSWTAREGKKLQQYRGHRQSITSIAFAPDGQMLATGGKDRTLRLWDVTTGEERSDLVSKVAEFLKSYIGRPSAHQRTAVKHRAQVRRVAYSPDGSAVAAATGWTATVWDAATGHGRAQLKGHRKQVSDLAFRPDGRVLATASYDGTVRLWDVTSGRERAAFDWRFGRLTALAFAPDGLQAAAAGLDGQLVVWDVDDV